MPDKKNRRPGTPTSPCWDVARVCHRDWVLSLAEGRLIAADHIGSALAPNVVT